jgi:hypothetical protein
MPVYRFQPNNPLLLETQARQVYVLLLLQTHHECVHSAFFFSANAFIPIF